MIPEIPLLSGVRALASDYDGFVLDLWGVIHNGISLYPNVVDTLRRIEAEGKKFVMLSNAPRRGSAVTESMIAMGMPEEFCGAVMSSGEATWLELRTRSDPWYADIGRRCLHIGPNRDLGLFEGLDMEVVETVAEADLILNTGPWLDDERVEDYETLLRDAAEISVPMICANPDLVVIRGEQRIICAGALAARFEELGGSVRYLGKPHPSIYGFCFEQLGISDRGRIVAVGDSLRTDIAGAEAAGIDSVLVVGGIHGDELGVRDGVAPDQEKIAEFCAREGRRPVAAIGEFVW